MHVPKSTVIGIDVFLNMFFCCRHMALVNKFRTAHMHTACIKMLGRAAHCCGIICKRSLHMCFCCCYCSCSCAGAYVWAPTSSCHCVATVAAAAAAVGHYVTITQAVMCCCLAHAGVSVPSHVFLLHHHAAVLGLLEKLHTAHVPAGSYGHHQHVAWGYILL